MENKKKENDTISNFKKSIYEREDQEREYLKKWKKEFRQKMNNSNNTYSTSIGHLSSSTISNGNFSASTISSKSAIHVDNDRVSINAPLQVNGRDILKELDEMRDVMLLLRRDVDMEVKYPRLRELKDEYEAALEKYKTFERLK